MTLLFLTCATISYATSKFINIFGLHPPCFNQGISRRCSYMSSHSFSNYNSRSRNFDEGRYCVSCRSSTQRKLHQQRCVKRKLDSWSLEGLRLSGGVSADDDISGAEAASTQLERDHSFKVFPEELIDHHVNHEHENALSHERDRNDECSIYLLNEHQDAGVKFTDGAACVSKVGLEFMREHIADKMADGWVSQPPHSHGLQEMEEQNEWKTESLVQKPLSGGDDFDDYGASNGILKESDHDPVKLKKRLSVQRQTLNMAYAELERQRTASVLAAGEAMAMISTLQKEKAAIQMEAVQYQRMAEEKEMFNEEVLLDLQDNLLKREAELLALEKEMELYRRKIFKDRFKAAEQRQAKNRVLDGEADAKKLPLLEVTGAKRQGLKGQNMGLSNKVPIKKPCNYFRSPSCMSTKTIAFLPVEEMRGGVDHDSKSSGYPFQVPPCDFRTRSMIVRDSSRVLLREEVCKLMSRLRTLGADRELMRQTIELRKKERGGMQLLQEVAEQLKLLQASSGERSSADSLQWLNRLSYVSVIEAEKYPHKRQRCGESLQTDHHFVDSVKLQ